MESLHNDIILQKLNAILEAIGIIIQRSEHYESVNDMLTDFYGSMVFDSCVMRLQTIGENIKAIDERTKGQYLCNYPSIPWKQIIGLRNIISHQYADVDPDVIWSIISKHLSPLESEIKRMKSELKNS